MREEARKLSRDALSEGTRNVADYPSERDFKRDPLDRAQSRAARPVEQSSELMTAKELEALLKIDVKTIYSYVQRGLIPYVRIQSNVRFVKAQITDWIGEHNYRPRPVNGARRGCNRPAVRAGERRSAA